MRMPNRFAAETPISTMPNQTMQEQGVEDFWHPVFAAVRKGTKTAVDPIDPMMPTLGSTVLVVLNGADLLLIPGWSHRGERPTVPTKHGPSGGSAMHSQDSIEKRTKPSESLLAIAGEIVQRAPSSRAVA